MSLTYAEAPQGIVIYRGKGVAPFGETYKQLYKVISITQGEDYIASGLLPEYTTFENARNNNLLISNLTGDMAYINIGIEGYNAMGWYSQTTTDITTEYLVLSKNYIETLDLLSEGEIEGLLSGKYVNVGTIGNTGWTSSTFVPYSAPPSYSGLNWLRSVYWNEMPLLSDNAEFNFQNIDVSYTIGTPNGESIESLIGQQTSSKSLNERLRGGDDNAKTYRILNRDCRAIIVNVKFGQLSTTYGVLEELNYTRLRRGLVQYYVNYRPLFSDPTKATIFSPPITEDVFGRLENADGYVRPTLVVFSTNKYINTNGETVFIDDFLDDTDFVGWEIKITRTTEDSVSSYTQNITTIESITEIYGNQLLYPNSAIARSLYNAEFFSSIPDRAFECNLLKVLVPSNYRVDTRTYDGDWDGTFKMNNGKTEYIKEFTNNPAWCFYDLLTNKRYGLGKYINDLDIDKFTLYKIGQYCDELVSDGEGGLEPRFTCNTWIAGREDAYKVVNDFASIFRGLIYYANGVIYTIQDSPKDSRVIFTNANVENGDFSYSSTSKRARQSVAIVRYNNPKDFYKPAMEYVEDINAIRKYGIRELDLTAFGCTSRNQAIRFGRWALLSNNIENETVQFIAGMEAVALRPGDIFSAVDYNRKLKRYGGRVDSISGNLVTLDSTIPVENHVFYKLSLLTPSYLYDTTQVDGLASNDYSDIRKSFLQSIEFSGGQCYGTGKTNILLTSSFNNTDYSTDGHPIWSVELGTGFINYTGARYFTNPDNDDYRVISIKENDSNKYEVVGLKYWAGKFNIVDSGLSYEKI